MRTKARFIAVMTAVLMVFAMMPMVAFGADDTAGENVKEYELWVGGTQVTSENCENIPAAAGHTEYSGKASYDPDTNTLTLDDYKYTGMGSLSSRYFRNGIDCEIDDLTVELKGDSVVTQSGLEGGQDSSVGMRIRADGVKIKGPGSLTLNAKGADGHHISYGLNVYSESMEITGGTVTANAYTSRYYCDGIHCERNGGMNITGGSLIATAEEQTSHDDPIHRSAGMRSGTLTVGANAGKVILSGHTAAVVDCTIKNEAAGKGWTNFEGTEGGKVIPVNTEGASYDYKRIEFPLKQVSYKVTFRVAGGSWNDGTTAEKTVTLSGYEGDTLKLAADQIPAVGSKPNKNYKAGSWDKAPGTETAITSDTTYTYTYAKKEPASVSGTLLTKMTAKGSNSLALSWNRIKGADGYDIFFAKCGKEGSKKVKTIKGNKTIKWTKKGLKKETAYRAVVKAYVMKGGKKTYVRTGPMVHAYTSGGTKVFTNARSVTVGKTSVLLKAGKKYKIKAKVNKLRKGKKLMPSGHAPKLRYISSNKKIATVSGSGTITAKAKGSCKINVIAVNGVSKAITVTVK